MSIFYKKFFSRVYMDQETGDGRSSAAGAAPDMQAQIDAAVSTAVSGLKAKNQELLGALKSQKEMLARFDGINPDAVRTMISRFANDEEAGLIAAGRIDEVFNKRSERMKANFEKETQAERQAREVAEARASKFSQRVLENAIRVHAVEAGIHPLAVEDALYRAKGTFQLDDDGNAVAVEGVLGKGGKPLQLKEWLGDMKERAPHWFPAGGSGGGAQQSRGGSGGDKTMSRSQFDNLGPQQKSETIRAKVRIVD